MFYRRAPVAMLSFLLASLALSDSLPAADAVVGSGTPASCDESALDSAVAAANSGGGTVTFACGAEPVTLALTGHKSITAAVTLDADGLVTLSGSDLTRHFVVVGGAVLTLRDITVVRGWAAGGGAVLLAATSELHLSNSSLLDNRSTTSGGAIQADDAVVEADRSYFAGNEAAGAGGAVHMTGGSLDLDRAILHGNSAGGAGGAVAIEGCVQLAVLRTSIDRNSADGDGGGLDISACSGFVDESQVVMNDAVGKGGGLHLRTGSAVALSYGTIGRNVAAEGGAVFVAAGASSTERQITISDNQASAVDARGGGIANLGTLLLENATVSGNLTAGSGGGLHSAGSTTLRFTTIAWNQAEVGGGIASSGTTQHLRDVILAGNAATTSGDECELTTAADIAASVWQGTSCGAVASNGNQPATDALLRPLGFSCPPGTAGEVSRTHDLDPASPAIDAGIPLGGGNAFMDQRTVLRPQGVTQDVGAVEFAPSSCPWLFKDDFERGNTFSWTTTIG